MTAWAWHGAWHEVLVIGDPWDSGRWAGPVWYSKQDAARRCLSSCLPTDTVLVLLMMPTMMPMLRPLLLRALVSFVA
jgi:hypothetical protein